MSWLYGQNGLISRLRNRPQISNRSEPARRFSRVERSARRPRSGTENIIALRNEAENEIERDLYAFRLASKRLFRCCRQQTTS
jgi:hypothetical protein